MTEHDVILSIRSRQILEGAEEETIEQTAWGRLWREGEGYALRYREGEQSGLEGTSTLLQLQRDRVILTRRGEISSQMIFREGESHPSSYDTPYGSMALEVCTRRLRVRMDDRGGEVELEYALEIGCQVSGVNQLRISVRTQEPEQEKEGERT